MIGNEAQDAFLRTNCWSTLTTLRRDGQPSTTVVAFACDDDEIVISTRAKFLKTRMLARDARATVTALGGPPKWDFVTVEGMCDIERDLRAIEEPTRMVFAAIGRPAPENLPDWLSNQGRVILRIRPERVYDRLSPPRAAR